MACRKRSSPTWRRVADLKVISRTSVMQYRDKDAGQRNLREIGQQLGVAYLLEGSVQRVGEQGARHRPVD